jgi:hypothetical protein
VFSSRLGLEAEWHNAICTINVRTWDFRNEITRTVSYRSFVRRCGSWTGSVQLVAPQVQSSATLHTHHCDECYSIPLQYREANAANALISRAAITIFFNGTLTLNKLWHARMWRSQSHGVGLFLDELPLCDGFIPRRTMTSRPSATYRGLRVLLAAAWLPCNSGYRKALLLTL